MRECEELGEDITLCFTPQHSPPPLFELKTERTHVVLAVGAWGGSRSQGSVPSFIMLAHVIVSRWALAQQKTNLSEYESVQFYQHTYLKSCVQQIYSYLQDWRGKLHTRFSGDISQSISEELARRTLGTHSLHFMHMHFMQRDG